MGKQWVIIGGWATPPDILADIFGKQALYVDINKHITCLLSGGHLKENWAEDIICELDIDSMHHLCLAGWSTGAIAATAIAYLKRPDSLVVLSPTPSFCRRGTFVTGSRPSILHSMRKELETDKNKVLSHFFTRAGLSGSVSSDFYSVNELKNGLFFLEQAQLISIKPADFPVTCFHGKQDLIIPVEAGRYFCNLIGGTMYEFEGSHTFFLKYANQIQQLIMNL